MKFLLLIPFIVFAGQICAQTPVNDECSGAIDLGIVPFCSNPAQYTNVNASASNIDPQFNIPTCFNNAVPRDVWFKFTLPADGSITDITASIWGNTGGNGTLRMPQVALYRGDCSFGGLSELGCAAAPLNVNEVHLNLLGLQAGETYYLRINDYSATGSPNAGTFKLCVEKLVPDFNMGEFPGSTSCNGTLWDSGGPTGEYSSSENLNFTICPQDYHQCISINFVDYDTEEDFDVIQIFSGNTPTGTPVATLSGAGANTVVNVPTTGCVTVHFSSDQSLQYNGFHLTWACSPDICPPPPPTPPAASTCATALNINGCGTNIPNIIHLQPGSGDPGFIMDGVNAGCIDDPSDDYNFSFFYFTAMANGQFGFLVKNADSANPSDLDFNVWGPIDSVGGICDYVSTHQPVRSSWTAAPIPFLNPEGYTGMTNTNPYNGSPVTDEFDCGSPSTPGQGNLPTDDSFVKTLTVQQGKIYVVMLDDYDGIIENVPGISIDFSPTTTGVLDPDMNSAITVSNDTSVCAGQSVQLAVNGGLAYAWSPYATLSCGDCPNPVATPTESTTYVVQAATTCGIKKDSVRVSFLSLDLGPDPHVCLGASFTLNPHPIPGDYSWVGSTDISCSDCPSPVFTAMQPGIHILSCTVTTPYCVFSDVIQVYVSSGQQPQLNILQDTTICQGTSLSLGGASLPGNTYSWTSNPPGFSSSLSNPAATPTGDITYYVQVTGSSCNTPRVDSVMVKVYSPPALSLIGGATICLGDHVVLGNTIPQSGVTYTWSPDDGTLSNIHAANPVATPVTGGVHTYFVTASTPACSTTDQVTIGAVDVQLNLDVPDSVQLCKGNSLEINASVTPGGANVTWSPLDHLQITSGGLHVVASPEHDITYTARVNSSGCIRTREVAVHVDSLPPFLNIRPQDTTICSGAQVTLMPPPGDPPFNPADYPGLSFNWEPNIGQITPDNLPVLTVQPQDTTVYYRIAKNGVCADTAFARINVVDAPMMVITPNDTTICQGGSIILSTVAPGFSNLQWSPAGSLSCSDCLAPVAQPDSSTTYTLTGSYNGCTATQSASVSVVPGPQYQFPNVTSQCAGDALTLNLSDDTTGTSYSWTSVPAINIPPVAQPQVVFNIPGTNTITFYLQANNGCAVFDSFTITYANVNLSLAAPDTLCPGIQTLLTASASQGGGAYSWSTGDSTQAVYVTPTETTTYTVNYTLNNCIFSDTAQIVVQGTTPAIDFPDDATICPGDSILLNSVSTPGATYQWTSQPMLTLPQVGIPPPVQLSGTTNFMVTATLGNCTITKTLKVTVLTAMLDVTDDLVLCSGTPFTISATGSATGTYQWTPGGTEATFTDVLNTPQTVHYALLYTYGPPGDECTLMDTVTVVSNPGFNIKIVADPDSSFNAGEEIMLDAVIQPSQNVNGFQFEWLENGKTPVGNTEQVTLKPETIDTSIEYVVYATNASGCSDTAIIHFRVYQPLVRIPNAFTPNGDGSNDAFGIVTVEGLANVELLEIYNRWGQRIYSSTDPKAAWNGTVDGKDAPSDVYVYRVRWRGSDGALHINKGEITLLR